MSVEGRIYLICPNGHIREFDYLDIFKSPNGLEDEICPTCKEKFTDDFISVDDTNCEAESAGYFEEIQPGKWKTCECCGIPRLIDPPRYKIIRPGYCGRFEFDKLIKFDDCE